MVRLDNRCMRSTMAWWDQRFIRLLYSNDRGMCWRSAFVPVYGTKTARGSSACIDTGIVNKWSRSKTGIWLSHCIHFIVCFSCVLLRHQISTPNGQTMSVIPILNKNLLRQHMIVSPRNGKSSEQGVGNVVLHVSYCFACYSFHSVMRLPTCVRQQSFFTINPTNAKKLSIFRQHVRTKKAFEQTCSCPRILDKLKVY